MRCECDFDCEASVTEAGKAAGVHGSRRARSKKHLQGCLERDCLSVRQEGLMPTGGGGDHGSPLPTNSSRAYLFRWRAEEGRDEPRRDQRGGRGVLLGGRLPPLRRRPTLNFGMEEEASERGRGNRIRRRRPQLYEYDPSTQLEWRTE